MNWLYFVCYLLGSACFVLYGTAASGLESAAKSWLLVAGFFCFFALDLILHALWMSSSCCAHPVYGRLQRGASRDRKPQRGKKRNGWEEQKNRDVETFSFNDELFYEKNESNPNLPIVYRPEYNITACGLENLHPADPVKYRRVFEGLVEGGLARDLSSVYAPPLINSADLLQGHSRGYLLKLHSAFYVTSIVEVPIFFLPSWVIYRLLLTPMSYATSGTIMACRLAMFRGIGINLGGGYHHACCTSGSGFCVYADISLGIHSLWRDFPDRVKKVMIVDLDAHQGNGHERDFIGNENVFIVDFYNPGIFPRDEYAKKTIAAPFLVNKRVSDAEYLRGLAEVLGNSIEKFKPDFILYNAGTDCMQGDPLGNMSLSADAIVKRDEIVFRSCLNNQKPIPIAMVLSGGYQKSNAPTVSKSILNLHAKFGLT